VKREKRIPAAGKKEERGNVVTPLKGQSGKMGRRTPSLAHPRPMDRKGRSSRILLQREKKSRGGEKEPIV